MFTVLRQDWTALRMPGQRLRSRQISVQIPPSWSKDASFLYGKNKFLRQKTQVFNFLFATLARKPQTPPFSACHNSFRGYRPRTRKIRLSHHSACDNPTNCASANYIIFLSFNSTTRDWQEVSSQSYAAVLPVGTIQLSFTLAIPCVIARVLSFHLNYMFFWNFDMSAPEKPMCLLLLLKKLGGCW